MFGNLYNEDQLYIVQALSTAMNGSVTNDEAQQLCRWSLALSAVLIEFAACGVPLHSSTAWSAAGSSPCSRACLLSRAGLNFSGTSTSISNFLYWKLYIKL